MKIMPNSNFVEVLRSSGGEKADGFSGGCEKVVLPVEVVPEKGEVVLGCFVETLILEKRRVVGATSVGIQRRIGMGKICVWWGFGWIVPWMFQCAQEVIPEGGIYRVKTPRRQGSIVVNLGYDQLNI